MNSFKNLSLMKTDNSFAQSVAGKEVTDFKSYQAYANFWRNTGYTSLHILSWKRLV